MMYCVSDGGNIQLILDENWNYWLIGIIDYTSPTLNNIEH